jgi:hypothetical protein
VNDQDLQRHVRDALALRDRQQPPPTFAATWRAAVGAAAAQQSRPPARPVWFRHAVAAALVVIALVSTWHGLGGRDGSTPASEAADLRLARELSPARQWPQSSDVLLRRYRYAPPAGIDVPEFEKPLEESYL